MFAAIRRASSLVSSLAADHRPSSSSNKTDATSNPCGAIKTLREVAHIARSVVGRMEVLSEIPRKGKRRKVSRIAARAEATRIAGYRVLTRSPEQERAVPRRQLPDQGRIARKKKRESQLFRQIRNAWEEGTYSLNHPEVRIAAPITSES